MNENVTGGRPQPPCEVVPVHVEVIGGGGGEVRPRRPPGRNPVDDVARWPPAACGDWMLCVLHSDESLAANIGAGGHVAAFGVEAVGAQRWAAVAGMRVPVGLWSSVGVGGFTIVDGCVCSTLGVFGSFDGGTSGRHSPMAVSLLQDLLRNCT